MTCVGAVNADVVMWWTRLEAVTNRRRRLQLAVASRTFQVTRAEHLRQRVRDGVGQHLHIWSFLVAVVLCGLVFGGVAAGQLNSSDTLALGNSTLQLLQAIAQHQLASASQLWWQRMIADGQLLALLWLLGVSIIGLPFIVIAVFLRGFSIGFAVGFTVISFGWRGFLLAAIGIFLHQIVSLTAIILAASVAIRFSAGVLRQEQTQRRLSLALVKYTAWFGAFAGLLMLGAAVQAYLAPHLLSALLLAG